MQKSLRVTIKILGILLLGMVLLCSLTALPDMVRKRRVSRGRDAAIAQLPDLAAFDLILIVREAYTYTAYGDTCAYGDGWIVMGTHLTAQDALNAYAEALQRSGWVLERDSYSTSRLLIRGSSEMISLDTGEPPWAVQNHEDYLQAREQYPVILFLGLTFYSPQREGC
jgi:hypothetical protein